MVPASPFPRVSPMSRPREELREILLSFHDADSLSHFGWRVDKTIAAIEALFASTARETAGVGDRVLVRCEVGEGPDWFCESCQCYANHHRYFGTEKSTPVRYAIIAALAADTGAHGNQRPLTPAQQAAL